METKTNKMMSCKSCGAEIAKSAKSCPKCGAKNKKPIYKRVWFIALVVIVLLVAISGGEDSPSNTNANNTVNQEDVVITYTAYSVTELMDDLDDNALKASEKYKDQYVELTGRLNVIDSSGKYISIVPTNDEWAIIGVTCYIMNDEQKAIVMEKSIDDTVVVKGKITDVGEVGGYDLDIDEIQ